MPTLRQRAADFLLGDERRKLEETQKVWMRAYLEGPGLLSPQQLVAQLAEQDSYLLQRLIDERQWERLGGPLTGLMLTETDRQRAVAVARMRTHYDTQSQLAVEAWTNFGFGRGVEVVPQDEDELAQEIWDEFWEARRNSPILKQRQIHKLSDQITQDGEIFFIFWADKLGTGKWQTNTLRTLATDQIAEIITLEDDDQIPLFYVQNLVEPAFVKGKSYLKVYYPDWQATVEELRTVVLPSDAILAADQRRLTGAVALHAAMNQIPSQTGLRGWPQFKSAYQWFKIYAQFLGDRAAVARKAAMYVENVTMKGGSRPLAAMAARLGSTFATGGSYEQHPGAVAGSDWIQNEQVSREWQTRDTGASGARVDGMTLLGQASAGTGVPLGWQGRSDAWQNRSVAEMVVVYFEEVMNRYQTFWSDVFSDMCEVVLRTSGKQFEDYSANVTLQAPIDRDLDALTRVFAATSDAIGAGSIMPDIGGRAQDKTLELMLTEMGVDNATEVLHPPEEEAPELEDEEIMMRLMQEMAAGVKRGDVALEDVVTWAVGEAVDV
jgi:hypothetical protein